MPFASSRSPRIRSHCRASRRSRRDRRTLGSLPSTLMENRRAVADQLTFPIHSRAVRPKGAALSTPLLRVAPPRATSFDALHADSRAPPFALPTARSLTRRFRASRRPCATATRPLLAPPCFHRSPPRPSRAAVPRFPQQTTKSHKGAHMAQTQPLALTNSHPPARNRPPGRPSRSTENHDPPFFCTRHMRQPPPSLPCQSRPPTDPPRPPNGPKPASRSQAFPKVCYCKRPMHTRAQR